MSDTDYGKESRKNYKLKHPDEDEKIDKGYERGEDQPDPDGLTKKELAKLRRKFGEKAIRYKRPANGYKDGDHHHGPIEGKPDKTKLQLDPKKEELDGGGIYSKDPPDTDKERCDNAYRWVEDLFWPKNPSPREGDEDLDPNWAKLKKIGGGDIDIGKRLPADQRSGWFCWELANFLAFLLRGLGYKVQYKNVLPSLSAPNDDGKVDFDVQTAAINVWFDGKWHLYDPFESFSSDDGGLDAYTKKKGNLGCGGEPDDCLTPYHDIYAYKWEKPDYDEFDWGAPRGWKKPEDVDESMKKDGWTRIEDRREAGFFIRNRTEHLRMGLSFGPAFCGYTAEGEKLDSLAGAVYRPWGRLLGAKMGDPDAVPAREEVINFNAYEPGVYPLELVLTNSTNEKTAFTVDLLPASSRYLRATAPRRALRGTLKPGESRRFSVPLTVKQTRQRPPQPVTDLRVKLVDARKVVLEWSSASSVAYYRVFRRKAHAILTPEDLAKSDLIGEISTHSYEETPRSTGVLFYAVLAVGRNGATSDLDVEEGSTVAVRVSRRYRMR